ncbi:MAG: polysaccharide deacetylase family protein [Mycobacteriales bacterium]
MNRRDFFKAGGLLATGAAAGRLVQEIPLQRSAEAAGVSPAFAGLGDSTVAKPAAASRVEVIWRVETDRKLIALTLDDGPMPAYTSNYLDMLEDKGVRATFSIVGEPARQNPDIVRRQLRLGHQLENHSYSHLDLGTQSAAVATREVVRGAEILEALSGRRPAYFRPPKGMVSGAALAAVGTVGADVLMWSLQIHERIWTVAQNIEHIVSNAVPGTILLAHDAKHHSIDRRIGLQAMPVIIDRLRDRGYEFVTVTELVDAGLARVPSASPAPQPLEVK